jgi:hypothetical protein
MILKKCESLVRFSVKVTGIVYLVGMMSFLGTELHAREGTRYRDMDESRSASSHSQLQLDRLRSLDLLLDSDLRREVNDLRSELAQLNRSVEIMRSRQSQDRDETNDHRRIAKLSPRMAQRVDLRSAEPESESEQDSASLGASHEASE